MPSIHINRCYCIGKPFTELLAIARAQQLTLLELAEQEQCGVSCGWCVAYLRRMLQTGETDFHMLLPKESLGADDPFAE
jgi:bacterioferritin-associated ferredoxin